MLFVDDIKRIFQTAFILFFLGGGALPSFCTPGEQGPHLQAGDASPHGDPEEQNRAPSASLPESAPLSITEGGGCNAHTSRTGHGSFRVAEALRSALHFADRAFTCLWEPDDAQERLEARCLSTALCGFSVMLTGGMVMLFTEQELPGSALLYGGGALAGLALVPFAVGRLWYWHTKKNANFLSSTESVTTV